MLKTSSDSLSTPIQSGNFLINDPYEQFLQKQKFKSNLIASDYSSKFSKKYNKLKVKMVETKSNLINGGMMGFMVGGLFGLVIGIYTATQTRRLISIPISVLISGISFGFIMACGSMIRSDELNPDHRVEQLGQDQWMAVFIANEHLKTQQIV